MKCLCQVQLTKYCLGMRTVCAEYAPTLYLSFYRKEYHFVNITMYIYLSEHKYNNTHMAPGKKYTTTIVHVQ